MRTPTFKTSVLLRKITKLEQAAVAQSWAGSCPPEEHEKLDKDYQKARLALINYVVEHSL